MYKSSATMKYLDFSSENGSEESPLDRLYRPLSSMLMESAFSPGCASNRAWNCGKCHQDSWGRMILRTTNPERRNRHR